ncbi:hypothetical protein D3C78_1554790 [compost metagenome]
MDNTATFLPMVVRCFPKDSINVLFPAPGTPVIPIRKEPPVKGNIFSNTISAILSSDGNLLSISVIALLSKILSWLSMPCTYSSAVCRCFLNIIHQGGKVL